MMVRGSNSFNDGTPMNEKVNPADGPAEATAQARPPLPDAARRALDEAEQRRKDYRKAEAGLPKEIGGRGGKEPGRYGDWEVKGIASDF